MADLPVSLRHAIADYQHPAIPQPIDRAFTEYYGCPSAPIAAK
jgi:hypothetical protein